MRLLWLRFYPRQTRAVLVGGVESAFASFGGVPPHCCSIRCAPWWILTCRVP